MSKFDEQQQDKKAAKEHAFQMEKMRREKRAGLYFDMAKLVCGGLVIGTIVSYVNGNIQSGTTIYLIIIGSIGTMSLILLGNKELK